VGLASWFAGEGSEASRGAIKDASQLYGEVAAHRAASLQEVTQRCLCWRDSVADVLRKSAAELETSEEALKEALNVLQLGLELSLVRMCKFFDSERQRTDEELLRREEELAFLATHDPLTGLPNRTLILDRVEQMFARAARSRAPIAALLVGLDNFRAVNDSLGRKAGDDLLQAVAARLDGALRGSDGVGRLGGDEFVVICEGTSLAAGPELIAERLLEALKPSFTIEAADKSAFSLSASIGIAMGRRSSAEELLRDADVAMNRAKWDGKNRYAVFESAMHDTVQQRAALDIDLRHALERKQFFLVYQPTLALNDLCPNGVEALIRWRHPERGIVPPDEFIPLAEETGAITDIGKWVLDEACKQGAAWREAGYPLAMAVNVSARQLDGNRLIEDVEEALARSGLDPEALTLEVTETALMRNAESTARLLVAIKRLGVRIAIDDFGTGYSSLSHLRQFSVDALKIDRSFISGLGQNDEADTFIHTLVELGKSLSIETVAEGIEDEEQLARLRAEDCESGQGYLFARPLEIGGIEDFMQQAAERRAAV
jgi:diguanylate cyclase (GGDEF)-like protein